VGEYVAGGKSFESRVESGVGEEPAQGQRRIEVKASSQMQVDRQPRDNGLGERRGLKRFSGRESCPQELFTAAGYPETVTTTARMIRSGAGA